MPIADALSDGARTSLDREFAGHMKFVFNQVLQRFKETGWSATTAERAGKIVWRLYNVYLAYKTKGKKYTAGEWIAKLVKLRDEAKEA